MKKILDTDFLRRVMEEQERGDYGPEDYMSEFAMSQLAAHGEIRALFQIREYADQHPDLGGDIDSMDPMDILIALEEHATV
jgi:hypothetical protein